MKMDESKLTAYALGELPEDERGEVAREVAQSAEARAEVDEVQMMARLLRESFAADRQSAEPPLRANLNDIRGDRWFWTIARPLSIAAVLAACAVIGLAIWGTQKFPRNQVALEDAGHVTAPKAGPSVVEAEMPDASSAPMIASRQSAAAPPAEEESAAKTAEADQVIVTGSNIPTAEELGSEEEAGKRADTFRAEEIATGRNAKEKLRGDKVRLAKQRAARQKFRTADYGHFVENPFEKASETPLSTFSLDVDSASYTIARRMISQGELPPSDAVRIEEFINYFPYHYPEPAADDPFSINLEVASCPWEASHRLVRVGLKGRELDSGQRVPSNLVFLLDVSGSMEPEDRLPLVKRAMRLLVERLSESDRVAIVIYAGGSGIALPSTSGAQKEAILSALDHLQAGGSTNGAEGIRLAYELAQRNFIKGGVNRVILATDGDFNVGVTSRGELIRLIEKERKTGVFLSVLGVGDDNLKDATMQQLADRGNGNYAYLDSIEEGRKVLVRQMNATLLTIAKDVKAQVEFNPAQVNAYRLLGYEKRLLRKEDFNDDKIDAGEIGAGHTVTALYEVVPVGAAVTPSVPPVDSLKYSAPNSLTRTTNANEMLTLKLRYKKPDEEMSRLLERSLVDNRRPFTEASSDFKFAAAVAELGMLLRDSEFKGDASFEAAQSLAESARGDDESGDRAGFLELVRKAAALKHG